MIVGIISPYSGVIEKNKAYLRDIMASVLAEGHSPVAGHAMYPDALDDNDPAQRKRGMAAGQVLLIKADEVRVYVDLGISTGMIEDIEAVAESGKTVAMWSIRIPAFAKRSKFAQ